MHGALRVTVVVKAAFSLVHEEEAQLAAPPALVRADRPTLSSSSVEEVFDLAPYLPSAGVMVSGHACAPAGSASASTAARLILFRAETTLLDKTLHVFGDRDTSPAARPLPFVRMPLTWERTRAYGGPGIDDNPVGVGAEPSSRAFPNIVDAVDPRRPAGFGPIGSRWPARARLLGGAEPPALGGPVVEIPDGFDWRWFHAAPADQQTSFLKGDEWIALDGMSPSLPRLQSRLPQVHAEARWYRETPTGRSPARTFDLGADTLTVDADRQLCWIVWRGNFPIESLDQLPSIRVQAGVAFPGLPVVWPDASDAPRPVEAPRPAPADPILIDDRTAMLNMREIAERALRPIAPFAIAAPGSRPRAAPPVIPGAPSSWVTTKPAPEPPPPAEEIEADTAKMKAKRPSEARLGGDEDDPHDRTSRLRIQDLQRPIAPFAIAAPGARAEAPRASIPGAPWSGAAPDPPPVPFDSDVTTSVHAGRAELLAPPAPPPSAPVHHAPPLPAPPPSTPVHHAPPPPAVVHHAPPLPAPPPALVHHAPPLFDDDSTDTETDEPQDPNATTREMRVKVVEPRPLAPFALAPPREGLAAAPSLAIPGAPWAAPPPAAPPLVVPPPAAPPLVSAHALSSAPSSELRRKVLTRLASGEPFDDQDLSRGDLRDLDFHGRSLVRCNLRGSQLTGCTFDGARLEGAQLGEADLTGASFVGADLARADLSRATLTRARFDKAKLVDARLASAEGQGASFRGATGQRTSFARGAWSAAVFEEIDILGADFTGAGLDGVSFRGAAILEIRLTDAVGSDVIFDDARLPDARAKGATLPRASFRGADAQRSTWGKARLDGAVFDGSNLRGASFAGASCVGVGFTEADLTEASLQEADVTGARFREASLRSARLDRMSGAGVDLGGAALDGADLRHARLPGASFAGAAMRKVRADHAALEGASFARCDLSESSLRTAVLRRAGFARAVLRGADLRDADLEGANLYQAVREGVKMAGANTRDLRDDPEPDPGR